MHLDLGHFVTATDGDYDAVTLAPSDLCFIVPEDTDTPFEEPGSFLGIVEEEHLDNFNATFPVGGTDNIEGSSGNEDSTSFNPNGDDNPATPDGDDDTLINFNVTTDVTSGTLTIVGGDGVLTWSFNVANGTPVKFGENTAIQILSKGDPVYFVHDPVSPNTILYGVANDDGGPDDLQTDDRIVFKIELNPSERQLHLHVDRPDRSPPVRRLPGRQPGRDHDRRSRRCVQGHRRRSGRPRLHGRQGKGDRRHSGRVRVGHVRDGRRGRPRQFRRRDGLRLHRNGFRRGRRRSRGHRVRQPEQYRGRRRRRIAELPLQRKRDRCVERFRLLVEGQSHRVGHRDLRRLA